MTIYELNQDGRIDTGLTEFDPDLFSDVEAALKAGDLVSDDISSAADGLGAGPSASDIFGAGLGDTGPSGTDLGARDPLGEGANDGPGDDLSIGVPKMPGQGDGDDAGHDHTGVDAFGTGSDEPEKDEGSIFDDLIAGEGQAMQTGYESLVDTVSDWMRPAADIVTGVKRSESPDPEPEVEAEIDFESDEGTSSSEPSVFDTAVEGVRNGDDFGLFDSEGVNTGEQIEKGVGGLGILFNMTPSEEGNPDANGGPGRLPEVTGPFEVDPTNSMPGGEDIDLAPMPSPHAGQTLDGLILTDPDEAFRYMTDIEERDPLYVDEGLVNPGYDAGGDAPGDLPAPSGGGTVDGAEFTFSDDLLMA